jgi:hypothetical protein
VGTPHFIPVEEHQHDGGFHLVRDSAGHLHCARWSGWSWRYSSDRAVETPVVAVAVRW